MKIPFRLLPASWGLKGKSREIAEAEYYLTGMELEKELARIQHMGSVRELQEKMLAIEVDYGVITQYEYDRKIVEMQEGDLGKVDTAKRLLEVDLHHYKITEYDYDRKLIELEETDSNKRELKLLDNDKKHGRLTENECEKKKMDLLGKPYVAILSASIDENNPKSGYFELDWNDLFVNMLIKAGYTGGSEEVIVNGWFNDLCRTIALQEYSTEDGSENATDLANGFREVR
jgi:hypothetical protein